MTELAYREPPRREKGNILVLHGSGDNGLRRSLAMGRYLRFLTLSFLPLFLALIFESLSDVPCVLYDLLDDLIGGFAIEEPRMDKHVTRNKNLLHSKRPVILFTTMLPLLSQGCVVWRSG